VNGEERRRFPQSGLVTRGSGGPQQHNGYLGRAGGARERAARQAEFAPGDIQAVAIVEGGLRLQSAHRSEQTGRRSHQERRRCSECHHLGDGG